MTTAIILGPTKSLDHIVTNPLALDAAVYTEPSCSSAAPFTDASYLWQADPVTTGSALDTVTSSLVLPAGALTAGTAYGISATQKVSGSRLRMRVTVPVTALQGALAVWITGGSTQQLRAGSDLDLTALVCVSSTRLLPWVPLRGWWASVTLVIRADPADPMRGAPHVPGVRLVFPLFMAIWHTHALSTPSHSLRCVAGCDGIRMPRPKVPHAFFPLSFTCMTGPRDG